jgi:hypothetical protein
MAASPWKAEEIRCYCIKLAPEVPPRLHGFATITLRGDWLYKEG